MSALGKTRLLALLAGVALTAAVHAQPAFRSAATAILSTTPSFRSATSAAAAPQAAFRAASSAATNTSSLAIGLPSGTAANDVLIAAVGVRPSSATITPPSGWTLIRRVDNASGQTNSLAVFRRVVTGSEPSFFTWDVTGAAYSAGGIQAFSGVDTANPVDAEAGQATQLSAPHLGEASMAAGVR